MPTVPLLIRGVYTLQNNPEAIRGKFVDASTLDTCSTADVGALGGGTDYCSFCGECVDQSENRYYRDGHRAFCAPECAQKFSLDVFQLSSTVVFHKTMITRTPAISMTRNVRGHEEKSARLRSPIRNA